MLKLAKTPRREGRARFVPRTAPPARKRGDVRHLVPFVIAERSGLEGKEDANKELSGPGARRGNRTGRRTSLPQGLRTGSPVATRNGIAPVAGFAGPRRVVHGALKPDPVTSSASSIAKKRWRPFPSRGLPGRRARPTPGGPGPRGHRAASGTASKKQTACQTSVDPQAVVTPPRQPACLQRAGERATFSTVRLKINHGGIEKSTTVGNSCFQRVVS